MKRSMHELLSFTFILDATSKSGNAAHHCVVSSVNNNSFTGSYKNMHADVRMHCLTTQRAKRLVTLKRVESCY